MRIGQLTGSGGVALPDGATAGILAFPAPGIAPRERSRPPGADWAAVARLKVAKLSTGLELMQRLARARAHLEAHLDRAVSLEELASIATLSSFHLARYFKRAFGAAPIAFHRRLRLERAARLLADGRFTVADAAESAGYSDAVAFTHAFTRQFGQSPRQWAQHRR